MEWLRGIPDTISLNIVMVRRARLTSKCVSQQVQKHEGLSIEAFILTSFSPLPRAAIGEKMVYKDSQEIESPQVSTEDRIST